MLFPHQTFKLWVYYVNGEKKKKNNLILKTKVFPVILNLFHHFRSAFQEFLQSYSNISSLPVLFNHQIYIFSSMGFLGKLDLFAP